MSALLFHLLISQGLREAQHLLGLAKMEGVRFELFFLVPPISNVFSSFPFLKGCFPGPVLTYQSQLSSKPKPKTGP